ncbi:MAG: hypothetical protein GF346_11795 [Candidatus Eisenbacteria bacterium]|nr:hypothetical protein [Candidatus Latescibacterota bacterium]MBD3303119.1 hypothetical protein [Candidatus Eisenbacteria bacterium]
MTEQSGREERDRTSRLIRVLAKDLAELARVQAKLTTDLVDLLSEVQGEGTEIPLHMPARTDDTEDRTEIEAGEADPIGEDEKGSAEPPRRPGAEPETGPEPVAGSVPIADPEPGLHAEPTATEEETVRDPEPPAEDFAETGHATAEETGDNGEEPIANQLDDAEGELELEAEDESSEALDTTVLVLESGDARVGVLWNQVVHIGTFSDPALPERIESEDGPVDLVSLGRLLHGVSREEKYYVVLADEGEKAAVACERMLGLGPLASVSRHEQDKRIQVLQVHLLKSFTRGTEGPDLQSDAGEEEPDSFGEREREERDRNGPRRALVAVRYLPARVAICRYLRGRGWQVGEAAGLEAAIVSLDLGHWDALFLEARVNGTPDEAEEALLSRVGELGVPVIRVGSRISGYPGHSGPSLMFPFSETELESILQETEARPGR